MLQAVLDSKHSIDADLADFQPWLSENDIAAVATKRLIQMPIGKGLHEVRQAKKMFSVMGGNVRSVAPILMMMDAYDTVLTTIDENVTLAAVGVRADSRGAVS